MARLDLPDKYRDEDSTERRKNTRRRKKRGGRRESDEVCKRHIVMFSGLCLRCGKRVRA